MSESILRRSRWVLSPEEGRLCRAEGHRYSLRGLAGRSNSSPSSIPMSRLYSAPLQGIWNRYASTLLLPLQYEYSKGVLVSAGCDSCRNNRDCNYPPVPNTEEWRVRP